MAIEEIPRAFVYKCDFCGVWHTQANAAGQYANSTPPGWMTLRFNYNDDQPASSHERPRERLLCRECRELTRETLKGLEGRNRR